MDHAPLYALQYIGHSKCTPFNTLKDSLIVIVTSSTIHLVSTSEWKEVVGLKTPKGKGEEALKFNTTSFLWPSKSAKSLKKKKTQEPEIRNKMRPFEVDNMEALYDKIVERCRFGNMPSTFTADGLRQTLSRPSSPAPGIALGTPLTFDEKRHGMVLESANPPSRRGGHLQRGRVSQARGRAESGVALGTNEEQQDLVPESSNPPRRGGRLQRGRVS